jgi:hypothetical protein
MANGIENSRMDPGGSPIDIGRPSAGRRKNVTPVPTWVLRLDFFADEVKRLIGELEHIQQGVDEAASQIDLELTATTLDAIAQRLQRVVDRERGLAAGE